MSEPRPLAIYRTPFAVCEWWPYGARTIFNDGAELTAAPEDNPAYIARARRLGYGGTDHEAALAMCREHELWHNLGNGLLGRASPVLWAQAHPEQVAPSMKEQGWEERWVLSL